MMTEKIAARRRVLGFGGFFAFLVLVALMVPDATLERYGNWVLIAMLLPANYFPIFYTVAFRWWNAHLGRALFTKAFGLAIVLDTALMVKYLGGEAWAAEIRFVAYSLVLVGMWYQSIVMTQIRIAADRREKGEQGPQTDLKGVDLSSDRHPEHP